MEREARCDLRARTTEYALGIIRMYCSLPKTDVTRVLGQQALRSGTSVGAHYREATRARSVAEFISKMEGGQQELEETDYWLELIVRSEIVRAGSLDALVKETYELMAIFAASVTTAKRRLDGR
ncbi:MAG: four helix bundle protein [Lentisphaerae bacterium RIFOXYB12_FULL_65_16]|nr:MAG: four helix bundle protein [Lentisphaerae bacterium RIFOXYA12_64_32]OGV87071.1 MAG: four helix bundle protein [Lentisphaerae bacterium RIFOXYB12_FULL_65_16]